MRSILRVLCGRKVSVIWQPAGKGCMIGLERQLATMGFPFVTVELVYTGADSRVQQQQAAVELQSGC